MCYIRDVGTIPCRNGPLDTPQVFNVYAIDHVGALHWMDGEFGAYLWLVLFSNRRFHPSVRPYRSGKNVSGPYTCECCFYGCVPPPFARVTQAVETLFLIICSEVLYWDLIYLKFSWKTNYIACSAGCYQACANHKLPSSLLSNRHLTPFSLSIFGSRPRLCFSLFLCCSLLVWIPFLSTVSPHLPSSAPLISKRSSLQRPLFQSLYLTALF